MSFTVYLVNVHDGGDSSETLGLASTIVGAVNTVNRWLGTTDNDWHWDVGGSSCYLKGPKPIHVAIEPMIVDAPFDTYFWDAQVEIEKEWEHK